MYCRIKQNVNNLQLIFAIEIFMLNIC